MNYRNTVFTRPAETYSFKKELGPKFQKDYGACVRDILWCYFFEVTSEVSFCIGTPVVHPDVNKG